MSSERTPFPDPYDVLKRSVQLSIPFGVVIGLTDLVFGRYYIGSMDLLTVAGLCISYLLINRGFDEIKLRHLLVFLAGFIFLNALLDGGLAGAGFVWSIGFPTVACFLAGARSGLVWSVGYAGVTALAMLLTRDSSMLMHYPIEPAIYGLVAYAMFTGFAYFTASSREVREKLLLLTRQDLQERKERLAESERNYRAVLNTTPNAIGVHCDGRWVYVNPSAVRLFGATGEKDILGNDVMDYIHPDHRAMEAERIQQMQQGNKAPLVEEKWLKNNGEVFEAQVQASAIVYHGRPAYLVICRDITEQKIQEQEMAQLRTQLEHSQRLDSLGVLAGGIAHDFNNLLAAIMGNAELASLEVEEGSKAAKFLSHVDDACERASSLCRRMLAYAGKGEFVIRPIDIYEYLQRLSGLLRASIGQRVRLNIDVDKGLPPVMADQAQFQQVMINFIVNASDAIGDNAGEVSLIGKQVYKDNAALLKYYNGREMNEGEYVSLRVKDTGCGMDEKTRQRIFDPFFTTKSTGNGLGLSATLGIIQRHKGGVCVASEPGIGSEFEILMPIYEQTDIAREIITADTINMMANGAVLVVDDEKSLRDLAGSLLGRIGFNVLFAENGEMGVEMFRAHKDDLAVVLLDMTMPKLGGIDTMRMMREIDPAIPILLVSGYSEETIDQLSETDRPDGFVQKPFRFKELKKAMFGVL